ncbi:MAG: polysaccharide biosynthesis tyrosine autokinase [Planctomycetales bacterium]
MTLHSEENPRQNSEAEIMFRRGTRFLDILWRRKPIIVVATAVGLLIGGLRIATFQPEPDRFKTSGTVELKQIGGQRGGMQFAMWNRHRSSASLQEYLLSGVVLEAAIGKLDELPPELSDCPEDDRTQSLRDMLAVTIDSRNLTQLYCESLSRHAPGIVINAVFEATDEFIDRSLSDQSSMIRRSLESEQDQLATNLLLKERELLKVKQEVGGLSLVRSAGSSGGRKRRFAGGGGAAGNAPVHPLVARTIELSKLHSAAQSKRVSLQAALAALEVSINSRTSLTPHLSLLSEILSEDRLASFRQSGDAEVVTKTRMEIVEAQKELAAVRNFYARNHPRIQKLTKSLQQSKTSLDESLADKSQEWDAVHDPQLAAELHRLLEGAAAAEQARESAIFRMYQESEEKAKHVMEGMAKVQMVSREADLLKRMHSAAMTRLTQMDVNTDSGRMELNVVAAASLKAFRQRQRTPSKELPLLVIAGFLAGIAIVYVMDTLDDRFRSLEELKEHVGVPLLGVISELPELDGQGIDALCVHAAPSSVETEAFRSLRTNLMFSGLENARLAITSAEPHDGKTTVIANLGVACTLAGKRTLLIDADLRSPGLTRMFNMRGQKGLSRILNSPECIADAANESIRESGLEGLHIIPCGPKPPNPSELLSQSTLSELIAWAEDHYDQILIDCPPVLAASDAAIVGRLVDGLTLVVQPATNRRKLVSRSAELLRSVGVEITGVIANRVGSKEHGYGYGYGYGQSYGYGHEEPHEDETLDPLTTVAPIQPAANSHESRRAA